MNSDPDSYSGRDGSMVLYLDETHSVINPDDTLARRLKNRERQRRYRERKRQQENLKNASIVEPSIPQNNQLMPPNEYQSAPVQVDIPVNVTSMNYETRVHCQRDWKKDARRAYTQKKQEDNSECTGMALVPSLDNNPSHNLIPSKRHWKLEARNKKSSE